MKKERFEEQRWDSLKSRPYYRILQEHRDVLPDKIPAELPLVHLQGSPVALVPENGPQATELHAGQLTDAFGAARVLNTLNVRRLVLDHIVTLEPVWNLVTTTDPGSATANALLTMSRLSVGNGSHDHQGWAQAEKRLQGLGMAHADLERSLNEAKAETARLQNTLDSVACGVSTELEVWPSGAFPSDAVPKDDNDAEVAGRPNALQVVRVANENLQQAQDRLRVPTDLQALIAHIVSMGCRRRGEGTAISWISRSCGCWSFCGNYHPISHRESFFQGVSETQAYSVSVADIINAASRRFPSKGNAICPGSFASDKSPPSGDNKSPKQIRFTGTSDNEIDGPEIIPKDVAQDDYKMSDGRRCRGPKRSGRRAPDDDPDPPRSNDDMSKLLPIDADLLDVCLDVPELGRMDFNGCILAEVDDVVLGATAEDFVVHATLPRDVIWDIIRRPLCFRGLVDVDRHVPDGFFGRAYKHEEEINGLVGVYCPKPPVATEPDEASERSGGDDDVSDMEDEFTGAHRTGRSGSSASTTPPRGKSPGARGHKARTPQIRFIRRVSLGRTRHVGSRTTRLCFYHRRVALNITDNPNLVDGSGPGEDTMFRSREKVFWFAHKEVTDECPSGFSDDFMMIASEHVLLMFMHP
ncbi:hypothetical protein PHMEG_0002399 [Phytophthora megakarya]|uniref:Reverse transcriptase n=1 Tax=Phytophthora megakarya TaxID=4795 RepID=A0A225WYG6_9STRA|nr:hypothetical protein PHMEG_0002399 [Phytophthora megakarya]